MTGIVATRTRVLAFADVRESLVAAARVHAPLEALKRAGLVSDYVVTDATLRGAPRRGQFDVVWLQRGADAWLAQAVADGRAASHGLLSVHSALGYDSSLGEGDCATRQHADQRNSSEG